MHKDLFLCATDKKLQGLTPSSFISVKSNLKFVWLKPAVLNCML